MGGQTAGPGAATKAFGKSELTGVRWSVESKAEAEAIAKAQLEALTLTYVTGEGMCVGRTDLRAGMVVKLEGLGKRFSGQYYVTATRHSYTPSRGYRTGFTVRRNAA
jgi:phage protein D